MDTPIRGRLGDCRVYLVLPSFSHVVEKDELVPVCEQKRTGTCSLEGAQTPAIWGPECGRGRVRGLESLEDGT